MPDYEIISGMRQDESIAQMERNTFEAELDDHEINEDVLIEGLKEDLKEVEFAIDDDLYTIEQAEKRVKKNQEKKNHIQSLLINTTF